MKKIVYFVIIAVLSCLVFSLSVFAASTDEFGSVEIINGIDLSKMSTDEKALVVLYDGAEYHTYPAKYIVKSSSDLGVDFSKLNSATGKSYGVGSIIRIVIPTTVKKHTTAINGNQGGKNLVEVVYPQDTQVSELVWGALMNCPKLKGIEIPATVTFLGQDAFSNCVALEYVTFAENSQLKTIDKGCFASCKKLTEIVLPNGVEKIGVAAFYNCTGLKKLALGANTTVFDGELVGAYAYGDANPFLEIYMNGAFATGKDSLQNANLLGRGNSRDLARYVIFFTGTKEQALSLVNKYNTDVNLKDVNIVAFDPGKTSGQDYLGMDAYTNDITVNTNRVLVYGYGVCDAFYEGEHKMAGEAKMLFTSYFDNVTFGDVCTREGCGIGFVDEDKTIGSMFTYLGYSYTEAPIGGAYSMSQFYKINRENIEKYTEATKKSFGYGFVIASVDNPFESEYIGTNKVIVSEQDELIFDCASVKVSGIGEAALSYGVVFCMYVNDGDSIFYLDGGSTSKTVTTKSYADIVSLKA